MEIVRFAAGGEICYGLMVGNEIRALRGSPFDQFDGPDTVYELEAAIFDLSQVRLLVPCVPSKIVAVGWNYRSHAEEMERPLPESPLIFLKPSTAVIGPEEAILYPDASEQVDYEGELAVVIGRTSTKVPVERAKDYVLGYTCFNDVTARDLQRRDGQWIRAKGFDTFAPMGPHIETELDPDNVLLETLLNGEPRQAASTRALIFSVARLISFVSGVMTLLPGDIIASGTPAGVGPMQPGDVVEVRIEGIGTLRNRVAR